MNHGTGSMQEVYRINHKLVVSLVVLFVIAIAIYYVWIYASQPSSYEGEQRDIIKTTISIDKDTLNSGFECQDIISITNSGDWSLAEVTLVDQTGASTINSNYILRKNSTRSYDVIYSMISDSDEAKLKDQGIPDNIINELNSNIKKSGAISENN